MILYLQGSIQLTEEILKGEVQTMEFQGADKSGKIIFTSMAAALAGAAALAAPVAAAALGAAGTIGAAAVTAAAGAAATAVPVAVAALGATGLIGAAAAPGVIEKLG